MKTPLELLDLLKEAHSICGELRGSEANPHYALVAGYLRSSIHVVEPLAGDFRERLKVMNEAVAKLTGGAS